jgi:hypothetical protein
LFLLDLSSGYLVPERKSHFSKKPAQSQENYS